VSFRPSCRPVYWGLLGTFGGLECVWIEVWPRSEFSILQQSWLTSRYCATVCSLWKTSFLHAKPCTAHTNGNSHSRNDYRQNLSINNLLIHHHSPSLTDTIAASLNEFWLYTTLPANAKATQGSSIHHFIQIVLKRITPLIRFHSYVIECRTQCHAHNATKFGFSRLVDVWILYHDVKGRPEWQGNCCHEIDAVVHCIGSYACSIFQEIKTTHSTQPMASRHCWSCTCSKKTDNTSPFCQWNIDRAETPIKPNH
jgi:hypothetical protein